VNYARSYGYEQTIRFTQRQREVVPLEWSILAAFPLGKAVFMS
jgi:hypothetical protein